MPAKRDIDSIYLEATAEVEAWAAEFEQEWNQADMDLALVLFWQRQDERVKQALRQMNPGAVAQVEQMVEQAQQRMIQEGRQYGKSSR